MKNYSLFLIFSLLTIKHFSYELKSYDQSLKIRNNVQVQRKLNAVAAGVGGGIAGALLGKLIGDKIKQKQKAVLEIVSRKYIKLSLQFMSNKREEGETLTDMSQYMLKAVNEYGLIEGETDGLVDGILSAINGASRRQQSKIKQIFGKDFDALHSSK